MKIFQRTSSSRVLNTRWLAIKLGSPDVPNLFQIGFSLLNFKKLLVRTKVMSTKYSSIFIIRWNRSHVYFISFSPYQQITRVLEKLYLCVDHFLYHSYTNNTKRVFQPSLPRTLMELWKLFYPILRSEFECLSPCCCSVHPSSNYTFYLYSLGIRKFIFFRLSFRFIHTTYQFQYSYPLLSIYSVLFNIVWFIVFVPALNINTINIFKSYICDSIWLYDYPISISALPFTEPKPDEKLHAQLQLQPVRLEITVLPSHPYPLKAKVAVAQKKKINNGLNYWCINIEKRIQCIYIAATTE